MFCSECGAPAAHAGARFCARCGTPLSAPSDQPPTTGPSTPAEPPTYLLTPPPTLSEPELLGGPRPPRPRPTRSSALAAATVALLAATGVVVALAFRSDGPPAGAGSPQSAVTRAAAAIAHQDVDGLLALVDPAEARPLRALVDASRRSLAKDDLVAATGVPEPWLHLHAGDLQVARQAGGGQSVAFVSAHGGSLGADVDERSLPDQLRPAAPKTVHAGTQASRLTVAGRAPVVAVVRVKGSWFLSPTTTILETVRRAQGLPTASFREGIDLDRGARDPEAVLTDLAAAARAGDLRTATSLVSQQELPTLAAYYPVFATEVGQGAARTHPRAESIQTSTQPMSDGLVKVFVENASLRTDLGPARYGGGCLTVGADQRARCIDRAVSRETGLTKPFVVVGHEDGGWRIQPVATVMEYLRTLMADGSRNEVYARLGVPAAAPITATLHVGPGQRVPLNDADFAHVRLRARPGTCFREPKAGPDHYVIWWADDRSGTDCYTVPAGGAVDGVVWGRPGRAGTTVTLDLATP